MIASSQIRRVAVCLALTAMLAPLAAQLQTPPPDGPPPNRSARLTLKQNRASATGLIGGESHDRYVIQLPAGARVTIRTRSVANRASAMISTSATFGAAEPAVFGANDRKTQTWTGVIPSTADYFIYVVAHPTAKYTLSVTVNGR